MRSPGHSHTCSTANPSTTRSTSITKITLDVVGDVPGLEEEHFIESEAGHGHEHAVETGDLRQAIGELVTCSRCVGTWVAGSLATAQVLAPRFGRILTWTLAAAALNDWLQAGFVLVAKKANEPGHERAG